MSKAKRATQLGPPEAAIAVIRSFGGIVRTKDALALGIHPRTLYELRDSSRLEQLSRGLYRLADLDPLSNPDLVTVSVKIPQGVLCLISALDWHGLTTQIPHEVYVALPRGVTTPRLDYPPVRIFRFGGGVYEQGIETHSLDGVEIRVYNREKTLADCFAHRNKIGIDVCIEAIREYRRQGKINATALSRYGKLCRVHRIMRPYLEAIL